MKISFVVPNRNNLKYFKWSYESIRKNQGDHEVWICSAVDACTDGTLEHYAELAKIDPHFKYIVNPGPKRLGHTILYDKIVQDLVETDLAIIWHCDMYLCPNALDAIKKLMYENQVIHNGEDGIYAWSAPRPTLHRIVSLTRIEPPLHPLGKEKIVMDFGTEPENFDERKLFKYLQFRGQSGAPAPTRGVFAPWAFWVDEFKAIGGHDALFAPQSREDDDIWNRLLLNGVEFLQTWEGFVYHLTCRGNRRNTLDGAPNIGTNNPEWEIQNIKSQRNFIRKWGYFVKHDNWHYPIISHKYNIACIISNCSYNLLANLEPWFSCIEVDLPSKQISDYVEYEQQNTKYDLETRVFASGYIGVYNSPDIICYIDGRTFNGDDFYNIQNLSDIITANDPEDGSEFELGHIRLKVNRKKTYERDLIVVKNEPINL